MALYDDEKARRYEKAKSMTRRGVPSLQLIRDAKVAVEYLIDQGGFTACTKEEFALKMGWTIGLGRDERADRRRVEDICNLTRDQDEWPEAAGVLGGYVIAYAPSEGGMSLLGDGVDIDARMYVHLLTGDLQKQEMTKTMNRRRQPMWRKVAEAFAGHGEVALARLFFQAEDQIKGQGVVNSDLVGEIYKSLIASGHLESSQREVSR